MRPALWQPPVAYSPAEQKIVARVRRAKLFVFLRQYRHEIFDEAFQAELAQGYAASSKGQPPVPPAQLALATILQAYTGVSDDEVIEALVMDRRWQVEDTYNLLGHALRKALSVIARQQGRGLVAVAEEAGAALPSRHLCRLPPAHTVYQQRQRAQRDHSSQ